MESAAELLTTNVPILLTSSRVPSLVTRHPNVLVAHITSTQPSDFTDNVTSHPASATRIINALNERLGTMNKAKVSYRTETMLSLLEECLSELQDSSQDLEATKLNTKALVDQLDEQTTQLDTQLHDIDIAQQLQDSKQLLQNSFDQFKWYRLWDIDTVGDQIAYHVATKYGVALERKVGCSTS